jgi:hypothetical protein
MNPRFRKVAVFVGTAALATGVGVGVASQGGETESSQASPGMSRPGGPGGGMDVSALAEELGVTTDKLQAALEAARPSGGAAPGSMAATLADELGISEAKVEAALEAVRPQGGMGGAPPADGGTPPAGASPPDDGATTDGAVTS